MLNKVKKTIEQYNMLKKSERILVGLSGGADSVSLLLCLQELGYNVSACHINHQLRGEESFRDENFCVNLCERLSIPIEVHRIDVNSFCRQNSCSVEEGARKLRYDIFSKSIADKIATAHTLSDSFETLIFNLVRGTGLKGLCSIPPVRENIVRPLINCTREDILAYLNGRHEKYVTDSTNLEADYSRNKIRLKAIPIFQEINTSLFSTFENTLENLKSDEDFLEKQTDLLLEKAETAGGYNVETLNNAHKAIKNRAIAKILDKHGVRYSFDKISDVASLLQNGGKINIQSHIFATCENNILNISKNYCNRIEPISITVDIGNEYDFAGRKVKFDLICAQFENIHKMLANKPLDYDKIKGKLLLRNRQNGDKITLCGRNFSSSVKKLFNASVPLELRDKTVILCDDDGLVWVEGFGCAERVKVDDNTKRIILCQIS